MALNKYDKARLNRDKKFDGEFVFAVKSTGIVCRPSCPSPKANVENVVYFDNIYQALDSGFRPCLRCRPDLYSKYHNKNIFGENMVLEAMDLIESGFLNENSVEDLSKRINVSTRHLRQLFQETIGTSPKKIHAINKCISAKELLLTSQLSVTNIAYISGFNSIRQFNDTFKRYFKMTPSQLRKSKGMIKGSGDKILVKYHDDFNFDQVIAFMQARLMKHVEIIQQGVYIRTFNINDSIGYFKLYDLPEKSALCLEIICDDLSVYMDVIYKVKKMFDLEADLSLIKSSLVEDDLMADLCKGRDIPRLPVAFDPYEFIIRAILGQQITVKAATTLASRIALKWGRSIETDHQDLNRIFPTLNELKDKDLKGLGITNIRVATISNVNHALANGSFTLDPNQSYKNFNDTFIKVKGIGEWTVNYVAMRGLGMADAFPAGDLGVIKALSKEDKPLTIKDLKYIKNLSLSWQPYRSYATLVLWRSLND